jgi:hypothetical protein
MLRLIVGEEGFERPFLSSKSLTFDEVWGYIEAMLVTPGVDPEALKKLTDRDMEEIQNYINSTQSATTFSPLPGNRGTGEIITSELIYYWMSMFNIPLECENWHLSRLFNLIRISGIKNSKPTKQNSTDAAAERARLNAERRERLGTRG